MATGPSLRKLTAHRSIHDGAHAEARDLTGVTSQLYEDGRTEDCKKAAKALMEHWKTRVIAHADAEEEGLYVDITTEHPHLQKEIHMLTRDHDLLRTILANIEKQLTEDNGVTEDLLHHFYTLLTINEIHSRSEESKLLTDE